MANQFSKEERVAFENIGEAFQDAEVMARNVSVYQTNQESMERSSDVIWRPMPDIMQSFDGSDQTNNFKDVTSLSVPSTIGFYKSVPFAMTAKELRDSIKQKNLGKSAQAKIASDINLSVLRVAALQGSNVIKRTSAATGFDDVALCDAVLNESGVPQFDRYMSLNSRDYNAMAGNLAGRGTMNQKPTTAYEKAYVGNVAGFETFKLDYPYRLQAAAGSGITVSTLDAAVNYFIPKATTTGAAGEVGNYDNRFQTITVSSTTGVAAGDSFTIAAVNNVHRVAKSDTGQLKTFRVISVNSSTTMTICPPLITNQVANDASAQYQNCVVNTKASNSAITFLNTAQAGVNIFWQKDCIELLPGRLAIPSDSGAAVMRMSTESGIELVMQKQYDIKTSKTFFRLDAIWGVVHKQPEMGGIMIFSQV